jgi:hypothetical protein
MLAVRAGIRIAAEYMNFPFRRKPVTDPGRHEHVIEISIKLSATLAGRDRPERAGRGRRTARPGGGYGPAVRQIAGFPPGGGAAAGPGRPVGLLEKRQ